MLTYLACPYSHPDAAVRQYRFEQVNAVAAELIRNGHIIFSPISHSHFISTDHGLSCDWEFWKAQDEVFVTLSSRVIVLMLDGWKESVGVSAEIALAKQLRLPIEYREVAQ